MFSWVAFLSKMHRNERNEMESKNLRKQEMETPHVQEVRKLKTNYGFLQSLVSEA